MFRFRQQQQPPVHQEEDEVEDDEEEVDDDVEDQATMVKSLPTQTKPRPKLVVNAEVKHLRSRYGLEVRHLAALFSHHRIHLQQLRVHYEFSTSNNEVKCFQKPFLPTGMKPIKVVAVGVNSWVCTGPTSVGVNITGLPRTRLMDQKPYSYVMHGGGAFNMYANELIFQTRTKNTINEKYPDWTEDDATKNVQVLQSVNGANRPTMYILNLNKNPVCPLALYKREILQAESEFMSTTTPKYINPASYQVEQDEYDRLVASFKNLVSDTRILMDGRTMIEVTPNYSKGLFHCSVAFDVYYTEQLGL